MKRALLLGLALVALAGGCGGGKDDTATPPTSTGATRPRDPGMNALRRAVRAVGSGDRLALWGLLSQPSRRRLGPTLAEFRRSGAPQVERSLRYFASHPYRKVVSQQIAGLFAVVAIAAGEESFAAPLRHQKGGWKLELGSESLRIVSVGPPPGSVSKVGQLAFELHGPQAGVTAVLYADDMSLESKEYTAPRSATVYANLASPLRRGTHNGVAFATAGDMAVAKAWTFLAR